MTKLYIIGLDGNTHETNIDELKEEMEKEKYLPPAASENKYRAVAIKVNDEEIKVYAELLRSNDEKYVSEKKSDGRWF